MRVTYRAVSCVRIDGSDGRLFRRELGAGEIPCWVSWVRLDGTDEILFSRKLGGESYRAGLVGSEMMGRTA